MPITKTRSCAWIRGRSAVDKGLIRRWKDCLYTLTSQIFIAITAAALSNSKKQNTIDQAIESLSLKRESWASAYQNWVNQQNGRGRIPVGKRLNRETFNFGVCANLAEMALEVLRDHAQDKERALGGFAWRSDLERLMKCLREADLVRGRDADRDDSV